MNVPTTPLPGFEIEFEVGVARGNFDHVFERGGAQRSSSQIRMKDDAGRIDDAPQRVALVPIDLSGNRVMEFSQTVVQAGERVLSLGYLLPDATAARRAWNEPQCCEMRP